MASYQGIVKQPMHTALFAWQVKPRVFLSAPIARSQPHPACLTVHTGAPPPVVQNLVRILLLAVSQKGAGRGLGLDMFCVACVRLRLDAANVGSRSFLLQIRKHQLRILAAVLTWVSQMAVPIGPQQGNYQLRK